MAISYQFTVLDSLMDMTALWDIIKCDLLKTGQNLLVNTCELYLLEDTRDHRCMMHSSTNWRLGITLTSKDSDTVEEGLGKTHWNIAEKVE